MNDIVQALALLLENPAMCSPVGSVRSFMQIAASVILAYSAVQFGLTAFYRRRWPLAAPGSRLQRIYQSAALRAGVVRIPSLRLPPSGACTIGFWRPDVCISERVAGALDDEELEAVALHELAHARRRDILGSNLLLFGAWVALSLIALGILIGDFTWHVGAIRTRTFMSTSLGLFLLVRLLIAYPGALLRELTCDDLAVRWSGKPLPLASALVKLSRLPIGRTMSASQFAAGGTLRRVQRLVEYRDPVPRLRLQRALFLTATVTIAAVMAFS